MKKYFIVELNEEGNPMGFLTNSLNKDFIKRYKITWHQEETGKRSEAPIISDVEVGRTNLVIYVFDMTYDSGSGTDIKSCIGYFNLFTEDYYDDVQDFIVDHWFEVYDDLVESDVKKFKDFI